MVGGSSLFFLIHAGKKIKLIISKITNSTKTQNYYEFVKESKYLWKNYNRICHNLANHVISQNVGTRRYFQFQNSVFREGRGRGWCHLCVETLGTVYISPWLSKQGLKSRAYGTGLLLSLQYRVEVYPEKMTSWPMKSKNSLRPLWRKRIPTRFRHS